MSASAIPRLLAERAGGGVARRYSPSTMEQHPPPPKTAKEKLAAFSAATAPRCSRWCSSRWRCGRFTTASPRCTCATWRRRSGRRPGAGSAGRSGSPSAAISCSTLYDFIGLHYLDRRLPYPKVALASFVGYAVSNSVGHSLLVGAPIRYRLYASSGLSAIDVGKLLVYSTTMIWVGFIGVSGLLFTFEPLAAAVVAELPALRLDGADRRRFPAG